MSPTGNVTSIARLKGKVVETGQAVEIDAPRRRKRKRGWREKVAMIDLDNIGRLELSGLEYRILFAVMQAVPEKGGCRASITIEEVAERVQSTSPSVSRAMKVLRDRRVLIREDNKIGRVMVNPWLMFNGDFDSWAVETDATAEPIWMRGVDAKTGALQ